MAQINKSSDYFNTVLYTGNGSTQSITGVGFQPDMIWVKQRNAVRNHVIEDAVRGTTKALYPNLGNAEENQATSITSFDSDGFSTGAFDDTNINTGTFVSWNWLASNTTASNTDGSITSTVSANTTSGFSIVSYTGTGANATVGHGLSSAPAMVIIRSRDDVNNWRVGHNGLTDWSYRINLESTGAEGVQADVFNSTAPTSSVFSVGTSGSTNGSGKAYISYCFAEKKGFSKFGSYTGNGSADGTFIYTGFKPAFIMFKDTGYASNWCMFDNRRAGYNSKSDILAPNTSGAEDTSNTVFADFLSNGFKWRFTNADFNASGNNYIYMAFASEPLVGTNNTPATAR
jgi:hypothetical protein